MRVVLFDGTEATQNVIFTVVTSPDVAQARMWGHMRGVVEAGNIYKRPLLADEAAQDTGSEFENNEYWATFNSVTAATNQCGTGGAGATVAGYAVSGPFRQRDGNDLRLADAETQLYRGGY